MQTPIKSQECKHAGRKSHLAPVTTLSYYGDMNEQPNYKEDTVTYIDADLYAQLDDPARTPQFIPGLAEAAAKTIELDNIK